MKTFEEICPDFTEWPKRWMVIDKDIPYGRGLIEAMRLFVERLIASGLKEKTIKKHIDNLWLLGGEIIRNVSLDDEYTTPPVKKLKQQVGLDGGPYCRHLETESELRAFDATCRKLHKFLQEFP